MPVSQGPDQKDSRRSLLGSEYELSKVEHLVHAFDGPEDAANLPQTGMNIHLLVCFLQL